MSAAPGDPDGPDVSDVPDPDEELVAEDDTIIGRAVRWSLLVFGLLGAAIAAFVLILAEPPPAPPPPPAPYVPPRVVDRVAVPPPVPFTDVTVAAGIDFVHENGATGDKLLPETMGGGAAFLDHDGDGDPDLLLVNSTRWDLVDLGGRSTGGDTGGQPPPDPRSASDAAAASDSASASASAPASAPASASDSDSASAPGSPGDGAGPVPTCALYANDGAGRFTDVTRAAGLDIPLYGMGCAVGDVENDGDVDVYVTAVGRNRLLRNDGGRFVDVTAAAGVGGDPDQWSTSAAFVDVEDDGDLDLFVGNYVRWSPEIDRRLDYRLTGVGRAYGPPMDFEGAHPYLFRNDGLAGDRGRGPDADGDADGGAGTVVFTDVSAAAGVCVANPATGVPVAKTLGVAPADVDGDGWIDLLVANDTVANFLFRNRGDGTFEEVGAPQGVAYGRNGDATGAMGIDVAHFRNDASLGAAIGNFANEMSSLYVVESRGAAFTDEAIGEGIGAPTRRYLSFGVLFVDHDLDGRLDLLQANGHLEDEINTVQVSQHHEQPAQLFWNAGAAQRASFVEVPAETTGDLAHSIVGRGVTTADVDGDGDPDVLITQVGRRPVLLRNDQALGHHWLRVRLVGTRCNRDAIGAWIELAAGGEVQRRQVMPTRSYLCQTELVVTFGLGRATRVDALRVEWPDGSEQAVAADGVDRVLEVTQE